MSSEFGYYVRVSLLTLSRERRLGGWDIITVLDGFFFVADLSWATLLT